MAQRRLKHPSAAGSAKPFPVPWIRRGPQHDVQGHLSGAVHHGSLPNRLCDRLVNIPLDFSAEQSVCVVRKDAAMTPGIADRVIASFMQEIRNLLDTVLKVA